MDSVSLLGAAAYIIANLYVQNRKRKKRSCKIRDINKNRKKFGFYEKYFKPMKMYDKESFFKYTRMDTTLFNDLLAKITPIIRKREIRNGISPEERLALTLHFLSQGSSMQTIAWEYSMGHATVHCIIKETCEAIWKVLHPFVLKPPTEEEWIAISDEFFDQWNFPNCLGAVDGKHIRIRAPGRSGSIVLLAVCDANHIFKLIDFGSYGSQNDCCAFKESVFGGLLEEKKMGIPQPAYIPGTNIMQPFVFVGAFSLKSYIQRPYPGHNLSDAEKFFNYRLSRARRCIENAFGIMTSRWRLLSTEINADVENIESYIKAIVCLHNFLKLNADELYCPSGYVDTDEATGQWRSMSRNLKSVGRISANRASKDLYTNRNILKNYFVSDIGLLPGQHKILTKGFV